MKTPSPRSAALIVAFALPLVSSVASEGRELDETPARDDEWGYRPATGSTSRVTPPSFCWRPQRGIVAWELECFRETELESMEYRADGITMNVHRPPRAFPAGRYRWRYRGVDETGQQTDWSHSRSFSIPAGAAEMPMPPRLELLARIPRAHPRLFVRPDDVGRLRALAKGALSARFDELVKRCDRLLDRPPPTAEPPKYGANVVRNSEEWRRIWWGNRTYTIAALDGAATLAFTRLLGGKEEYGREAKRILMECAEWDPHGATGYRYNDEAGMPYAYYFARTYTFIHDLLTEEERRICQRVLKARGDEMYGHLFPRHLWRPFSSHSNRAWHFLGEVGIALLGDVEAAEDWVWFAMNVFYNVYPVWSDDDGGWHEGFSYWNSYLSRFTWWADVMRAAMGVNAFDQPYFSQAGYYPMYLLPPGKVGAGFGDLNAPARATRAVPLVSQLARQAGNGHWEWYVRRMGGPRPASGYIGFVRGALPETTPKAPSDLPASRLFRGTGQAVMNTTLEDARNDVQVVFKSSPFGTQSHGYEANNSFLLWAYGQRLLIRSGYRDSYGTEHHRGWMWSTRSVNNITVDGYGQLPHSASSRGRIVAFETTPSIDFVVGEAGDAYRIAGEKQRLLRFTRAIIFVKPDLVIVYDRLLAPRESAFEYWLHATEKFEIGSQREIDLKVEDVRCRISLLAPEGLEFTQTNQYDPNPRPRIKLREWHLTARTPSKTERTEFVALFRPHRAGAPVSKKAELRRIDGGFLLKAGLSDGAVYALLPTDDAASLSAEGLHTAGKGLIQRRRHDGSIVSTVELELTGPPELDGTR